MKTMKQKLLPCPFCGDHPSVDNLIIYCDNYSCRVTAECSGMTLDEAIQRWNTRADHILAVTEKIDDQTLGDDAFDAERCNMLDIIVDLGNENEKLKANIAELEKVKGVDFGQRAHELQLALINQGKTDLYEIDRKVESMIRYQCLKSGDDRFNQLKQQNDD